MTSQSFVLENDLLPLPKQPSVVIQIEEIPLTSPTSENVPNLSQSLIELVGKMGEGHVDTSRALLDGLKLERPQTGDGKAVSRTSQVRGRRSSSVGSTDLNHGRTSGDRGQRRPLLQLPSFKDISHNAVRPGERGSRARDSATGLPRVAVNDINLQASDVAAEHPESFGLFPTQSWPLASHLDASAFHFPRGIQPLLTPPEDIDSFKWDSPIQTAHGRDIRTIPATDTGRGQGEPSQQPARPSPNTRPSEIQMPEPSNISSDESNMSNWLTRACQHLVLGSGDANNQHQIQMVVQALPSQAKKAGSKPVFEKVVEVLQSRYTFPPYITITHAVSQVISMDEVPASPPATPNTQYASDDYFQDQTIFTHAAVVPAYHAQFQASSIVSPRPTNIIAAPSSIQVTTLERYIPPTTAQEVQDFFTLSRKSYLADRLLELSANNGTLLLVYPTRTGAMTFAKRYIGPVIEPFLRKFILLNSLFINIAVELGRIGSLESMKEFSELRGLVAQMCGALGQRAPSRGQQSRYDIVHAETTEVVLEETVWKEWFLEQEQPRLRQNLFDYHKTGGRMPIRAGKIEVTPGMLAREVVEGIRSSQEPAGNVGMEVAVFVIRRSVI